MRLKIADIAHIINIMAVISYVKYLTYESEYIYMSILSTVVLLVYVVWVIFNRVLILSKIFFVIEAFIQIILLYANLYNKYIDELSSGNHSLVISKIDLIYYSITTFTTTGYGDIYPISDMTKTIAASEMIAGYFFSGIMISLLVNVMSNRKSC